MSHMLKKTRYEIDVVALEEKRMALNISYRSLANNLGIGFNSLLLLINTGQTYIKERFLKVDEWIKKPYKAVRQLTPDDIEKLDNLKDVNLRKEELQKEKIARVKAERARKYNRYVEFIEAEKKKVYFENMKYVDEFYSSSRKKIKEGNFLRFTQKLDFIRNDYEDLDLFYRYVASIEGVEDCKYLPPTMLKRIKDNSIGKASLQFFYERGDIEVFIKAKE